MATRKVMCSCGIKLAVSIQAQAVSCPMCRSVTILHPANGGYDVPAANQYDNYGNYPIYGYGSNQQQIRLPQQVSPVSVHGSKRALLCGINYYGHDKYLKGSINDVNSMKYFLIQRMGFPHQSIYVLTEEEKDPARTPTKRNIREAMRWLVEGCRSGDSLVFHYSGHAAKLRDTDGDEVDGFDESLCPLDYQIEGKIVDEEINATLVRPLPHGAKLHAIIDTCFSGTFLDLPFMCRMNHQGNYMWEDHRISHAYKGTNGGMAICFSACDDNESSGDTTAFTGGSATGAMTYSFINVLEKQPRLTYGSLLDNIRNKIREAQTRIASSTPQVPQLSSTEKFDIHSMTFML